MEGYQPRPFGCEVGSHFHRRPRFQPSSLKFRTSGFPQYGFKHQAPRSSVWSLPPRYSALKLNPQHSRRVARVYASLRYHPHRLSAPPLWTEPAGDPSYHLGPEVLARDGLCCPLRHRLATSSASLETSVSFPSVAGYRAGLWHSRIILPSLHTFRTFTVTLSRIAAFSFRRESSTCKPQFFRTSTGHRVEERNPWQLQLPRKSAPRGTRFRRLVRSLSLRPFCLLAPKADRTGEALCLLGPLRLLHPGFQPSGHPE